MRIQNIIRRTKEVVEKIQTIEFGEPSYENEFSPEIKFFKRDYLIYFAKKDGEKWNFWVHALKDYWCGVKEGEMIYLGYYANGKIYESKKFHGHSFMLQNNAHEMFGKFLKRMS